LSVCIFRVHDLAVSVEETDADMATRDHDCLLRKIILHRLINLQDKGASLSALTDNLGYSCAGETEDIHIVDPDEQRTYGVLHIEATEKDLIGSLYQGIAKVRVSMRFVSAQTPSIETVFGG
jgi:hypothetical protein